jgi:hypothetical protein
MFRGDAPPHRVQIAEDVIRVVLPPPPTADTEAP